MNKIIEEVKKELTDNTPLEDIRKRLSAQGLNDKEAAKIINKAVQAIVQSKRSIKGSSRLYVLKEIFDKIGYGFGSQQFVNILFFLTGASFFLIGLVNGAKIILSTLISLFTNEYSKVKAISKKLMGRSAIIFGFTFLLISAAIFLNSVILFALAILIGSISIVPYGEFYQKMVSGKDKVYLKKTVNYGLIITAVSLFIGAYLMDTFPISGIAASFTLFGKSFSLKVFGYLIVFEITALAFILSGYVLSLIKEEKEERVGKKVSLKQIIPGFKTIKDKLPYFLRNKLILMLIVAGILTSIVQTIGNSYYGIFIYNEFKDVGFGGFLNVAIVFLVAVFSSLFGSLISKIDSRAYGKFPTLVFGTLLMSIMPLSYYYKPNLVLVTMGTISGVIGAAIVGVASGLLVLSLIHEKERKMYFSAYGICTAISYVIFIPFFSYFAHASGLANLFLLLALVLVFIVVPLYIAAIIINKEKL